MPSPARLYDFYLGGRHNFAADRAAAQRIITALPDLPDAAWANRSFHQRAARWLAEQGIRQFIDIGSGLPTVGNTHEIVQAVAADARVVYVDNDPMVALFSAELLKDTQSAAVVTADLRDPPAVLGHPELRALIDLAGGFGIFRRSPLEQLFRDARLGRIHPANSMLTHEIVAKTLLGISPDETPRWG